VQELARFRLRFTPGSSGWLRRAGLFNAHMPKPGDAAMRAVNDA